MDQPPQIDLIPDDVREQFRLLLTAVVNHELAVIACKERGTDKDVYVICVAVPNENGSLDVTPLARMFAANPYAEIVPPLADATTIIH